NFGITLYRKLWDNTIENFGITLYRKLWDNTIENFGITLYRKLWDIIIKHYHFFRYLEVSFLLISKLGNTKMVIEEAELRFSDSYIPYISE
ncbi:8769_t:CDS:2, partial [Entrophospora sp. SA101]